MDPASWERLPNEILENIFLNIPTYQIPFNNAWVCQKWTKIILNIPFWVNKLKICGIDIDDMIWSVLQKFESNKVVSCLYHACLYQEYRIQQTPFSKFHSYIPYDENVEDDDVDTDDELQSKEAFEYDGVWVISDNFDAVLMALGVLVCRKIRPDYFACLSIKNKEVKGLPLLLKLLEARNVPLYVRDNYAFWNLSPSINYLQCFKGNCDKAQKLLAFRGCLLTLEGLPSSLSVISLSIAADENGVAIDPGLSRINQNDQINLYFKAGTNISKLPKLSLNALFVSDLEASHILWVKRVTEKFLRNDSLLILLDYQLDLSSSENLLKSISEVDNKDFRIFFLVKNECDHLVDTLECLAGKYDNIFMDLQVWNNRSELFEVLTCYFETFFEDDDINLPSELYMSKYGR